LAIAAEVAQVQVAEHIPPQVEVETAYKMPLETKTGILDWMTKPQQKLMQFDGSQAFQQDDFIKKLSQSPEKLRQRAVEARWMNGEDGTRTSGVAWSDCFLIIVRQVNLIEFQVHVAVETMEEALQCDVGSVGNLCVPVATVPGSGGSSHARSSPQGLDCRAERVGGSSVPTLPGGERRVGSRTMSNGSYALRTRKMREAL
jgi:hypothetical protein